MTDPRTLVQSYAAGYRCPDCDSDSVLSELAPGVFGLDIHHDPTCPYLAEIERRTPC